MSRCLSRASRRAFAERCPALLPVKNQRLMRQPRGHRPRNSKVAGGVTTIAENQQSLGGVTRYILGQLASCRGFVAVLHNRGTVSYPGSMSVRGSVWVEQGIAIVALRTQALAHRHRRRDLLRARLKLEDLRSGLLLNSVQSETVDQILSAFAVHAKAGLFSARKERTAYRPALPPLSPALCRSRVQYAERARAAPC
jgi:hypothetical protein